VSTSSGRSALVLDPGCRVRESQSPPWLMRRPHRDPDLRTSGRRPPHTRTRTRTRTRTHAAMQSEALSRSLNCPDTQRLTNALTCTVCMHACARYVGNCVAGSQTLPAPSSAMPPAPLHQPVRGRSHSLAPRQVESSRVESRQVSRVESVASSQVKPKSFQAKSQAMPSQA